MKNIIFATSLNRTILIVQIFLTILLCYKLSTISRDCEPKYQPDDKVKYVYTNDYPKAVRQWSDDIYHIGMKHRSSKFYLHGYQTLYGIHLGNNCQVKCLK